MHPTLVFLWCVAEVAALSLVTLVALCAALDCQPADLIEYRAGEEPDRRAAPANGAGVA
jgi:DNA-binding Xre family transcriptional regulator